MSTRIKHINKLTVIKYSESKNFINEFNKNKITDDFLKSCMKAGDLFNKKHN